MLYLGCHVPLNLSQPIMDSTFIWVGDGFHCDNLVFTQRFPNTKTPLMSLFILCFEW